MPWSTRAFAFNITHPGSSLFLGVFDYDENFLVTDYHDPVGRVVVNTINFESGVSYLLHYDLIHSEKADEVNAALDNVFLLSLYVEKITFVVLLLMHSRAEQSPFAYE